MLNRLDTHISLRITDWIREHLEGCEKPRKYGKPLKGRLKEY